MHDTSKILPGTPTVTLAGKVWPVPELAVRQLRYVRKPIIELTDRINAAFEPETRDGKVIGQRLKTGAVDPVDDLDGAEYDRLIAEVVWQGLTRANPDLTFDEVLDMTATPAEMFRAWLVIRKQSRIYLPAEASSTGEGLAADRKNQTGTI